MSFGEDKPGKVLRVALLGLRRSSATQVARLARRAGRRPSPCVPARGLELVGDRGAPDCRTPRPRRRRRAADDGRDGAWRPRPDVDNRHRGDRRHRARPRALILAAMESGKSVVHRQTRRCSRSTASRVPRGPRGRSAPTFTYEGGGRRGRSRSCGRWREFPRRRRGAPRARHRQRHHPNFILDRMDSFGRRLSATRWKRRKSLGYAEADPTADVEAFDAAAKAAILAGLAFHTPGDRRRRLPRGQSPRLTAADHRVGGSRSAGSSSCWRSASGSGEGRRGARSTPAMIPRSPSPRGGRRARTNAVFVEGGVGGSADVLTGAGGRRPPRPRRRCSATWSPFARQPAGGHPAGPELSHVRGACLLRPMGDTLTRYHVSLDVGRQARACSRRSPRRSPGTASRSRRCSRPAGARTPCSSS